MKKILSVLLVLAIGVFCASCGILDDVSSGSSGGATTTKADKADSKTTASSDQGNTAKVGETVEADGIQFTFDSVEYYEDKSDTVLDTPDDGKKYLLLWFTISNTTDEDTHINMFYEDSYCDDTAIDPETMFFNLDGNSIWGDIAAGKKTVGYVGYQVKEDWKTIEFQYSPDVFGDQDSKLIFTATPADITE